jgi:acetyl/propionyl-CoA carboxylase alpha subunit
MQRRIFRQIKPLEKEDLELEIENLRNGGGLRLHLKDSFSSSTVRLSASGGQMDLSGSRTPFAFHREGSKIYLFFSGRNYVFEEVLPFGQEEGPQEGDGQVVSKMPGRIIKVAVKSGDPIGQGELVLIMESMKMENRILAAFKGKISELFVSEGDLVESDQVLLRMIPDED